MAFLGLRKLVSFTEVPFPKQHQSFPDNSVPKTELLEQIVFSLIAVKLWNEMRARQPLFVKMEYYFQTTFLCIFA